MAKKLDFIEAYRKAQPNAPQEIVEARQKSHDKLYAALKTMPRVYDLCRLAFDLPQDLASLSDWFQPAIKEFDPRFSLSVDKAEAGRIAALLLRDLMSRTSLPGAFSVLITSFGGSRVPIDQQLLINAHEAVAEAARTQRIVLAEKKIAAPAAKDLKEQVSAVQGAWNPDPLQAALRATISEARTAVTGIAQVADEAHQALRNDTVRLAEEVDMLWWHIGDWSEWLDIARTDLPKDTVGVVSGIELGQFVRKIPGPYGAYGILRRALGKSSDKKAKLKDVVQSLGDGVAKLATQIPDSAVTVFPVHTAILLASELGTEAWPAQFEQKVGPLKNFELSHLDLAVQTFRERVLIKYSGLS